MKAIRFLLALGTLILSAAAHSASGQTPPVLGMQLYAGVNITGSVGSIYAIQSSADPSNTNGWGCVALVQLPATNYIWTDTSKNATTGQRFYRAVLTATNLVAILPGTFTMGSPTNEALRGTDEVQHVVTISKGFYMGKYLTTQGEYLAIKGSNPSQHSGDPNYPVDHMRWTDANSYCTLRTALERTNGLIPMNWGYRLPTESEWEYACRAGTVTACFLGSSLRSAQANFAATNEYDAVSGTVYNATGVSQTNTTVVGSYQANGWGLYDMAGNLCEHCQDRYGAYPTSAVNVDPQGPGSGTERVYRGGAFNSAGVDCRSAARFHTGQNTTLFVACFRVVLAPIQ